MAGHTLVVGGGIVGVCTAYYLAQRGERVTLLEREPFGDSASCGNAGLIALGHPPLPRPGMTWKALRWMLDPRSPLYIPPRPSLSLVRWLWRFRQACRPEWFKHSQDVLSAHGWHAGACFRALVEREGLACEYRPVGWINAFRTERGLRDGAAEADMLRGYGYEVEMLDGDALREREPAFRDDVAGAAVYRDSAFANPRAFLLEMVDRIRALGVDVRESAGIDELLVRDRRCVGARTDDGNCVDADVVVLAAGVWSDALGRRAGLRVPMQPAKGYHVSLTAPATNLNTACVLAESFVAANPIGGGLRLAGTLEFSGISSRIVERRVDALKTGAGKYLHGIDDTREVARWCGLRPCTSDGLPVIGWAPRVERLFVATGHAMMGFTLGPLAGRLASEAILDGTPSLDLSDLSPARFDRTA